MSAQRKKNEKKIYQHILANGTAAAVTGKGKFTETGHGDGRQRQLAETEMESANLRQQVAILEDKLESRFRDWVIPRDEIQISDISLGAGGWAEVFEGRYCGYSVAVKQIHEAIISPHNQNLFWREIDIASRCRHLFLLQSIGATNDGRIPLFITKLMEKRLRQLL